MFTHIATAILLSTLVTSAFMILLSSLMNCINYKKYKKSYNLLESGEYGFNWRGDNMYFFSRKDLIGKFSSINNHSDLSLVVTLDKKGKVETIRLPSYGGEFGFIHLNLLITLLDPYTMHYAKKFKKWFEANKSTFQERTPSQFEFTEEEIKDLLEIENN